MLNGKKIVLGITGSIAAYKACLLIRALIKQGAEVQVVITPAGKEFITPITLSALTHKPVISEFFSQRDGTWNSHVDLGLWADAMVIAPCTASTLGKMAHGIADNMLITTYLSMKAPVFVAPAMDLDMYAHPSTQDNLRLLQERGVHIIEPGTGFLASTLEGKGRMEEPDQIAMQLDQFFAMQDGPLRGQRVLITAGPTYEKIDPVRFIGNYSSGKMGIALANQCAQLGAEVELVCGPCSIANSYPQLIHRTNVESAQQMYEAATGVFPQCNSAILCAAVADFTPDHTENQKMKREGNTLDLHLNSTPDIARAIGQMKREDQKLIGFALETHNERQHAQEKLQKKNLDYIVMNSLQDAGAGFQCDTNKVTLISRDGQEDLPLMPKTEVAGHIVRRLLMTMMILVAMVTSISAQELKAKVLLNTSQIQTSKTDVFESLKQKMEDFLNNHQWTQMHYRENEKINCNLNLTVSKFSDNDNAFECSMILTQNRPVFNSSYTTTTFSVKDPNFNFSFQATDQLEYNHDNIDNQLIALMSYYAYIVIGMDLDTFSPLGGTTVLQVAEDIVAKAQNLGYKGWASFDDNKNRFGLLNDYMDGSMESIRQLNYQYHRQGLDRMTENIDSARIAIVNAMDLLEQAHNGKNMSHVPQLFTEYKKDELVNIFQDHGTSQERERVYNVLMAIDASQNQTWEKLKK